MSTKLKKLMSPQEDKAIAAFRNKVGRETGDKLVGLTLFGSRARGEGTEDSDIDVLVLLSAADETLKVKIWDIAYRIFADTDVMISPMVLGMDQYAVLDSRERLIAKSIKEEGIPL